MSSNHDRPVNPSSTPVLIGVIIIVGLVLGGVFGLVLAGRDVDDFLTSVTLIAVPASVALIAVIRTERVGRQVEQNGVVLENVRSLSNGRTDSLLSERKQLEAQLIALGHTPITHADVVSAENKGRHSDG